MLIYFGVAVVVMAIMLVVMFATDDKHPFDPMDTLFVSMVIGIIWPASWLVGGCWFIGKWIKKNYLEGVV